MKKGKLQFETKEDRGYIAKAWDLEDSKGDALIEILKDDKIIRSFKFPAYKIWNIGAHFHDIVDSEIAKDTDGYSIATSDGLGGHAPITPVENSTK